MQLIRREGKLVMDYGSFEAGLVAKADRSTPTFVVRYRLVSDPSNLSVLRSLAFTLLSKTAIQAAVWESGRRSLVGLNIDRAPDVVKLSALLLPAHTHPRYDVVKAWDDCAYWLTARVRERLGAGERYCAADYLPERKAAVARLRATQGFRPPVIPSSLEVEYVR